jgi:predicted nuclease with TOPRIM domain
MSWQEILKDNSYVDKLVIEIKNKKELVKKLVKELDDHKVRWDNAAKEFSQTEFTSLQEISDDRKLDVSQKLYGFMYLNEEDRKNLDMSPVQGSTITPLPIAQDYMDEYKRIDDAIKDVVDLIVDLKDELEDVKDWG